MLGRCNSSALAVELCLSCTNPSIWSVRYKTKFGSQNWLPNLVTICAWLPKLVANVSSNFHHLVNTGLAVGSFFKLLPITVAHTCKLDTIWVVYISTIGNGSIWLQSPLTHYALWNFTSSGAGLSAGLQWARWCSYLKQLICSCLAS